MNQPTTEKQPVNCTPTYILLTQDGPLGPPLMQFFSGPRFAAVFGFSGKERYDQFIEKSTNGLKPYPLTPRSLEDQIELKDKTIRMIVLDANSPDDASFNAASIATVLKAQQEKVSQIEVGFRLVRTIFSNEYRVERTPLMSS